MLKEIIDYYDVIKDIPLEDDDNEKWIPKYIIEIDYNLENGNFEFNEKTIDLVNDIDLHKVIAQSHTTKFSNSKGINSNNGFITLTPCSFYPLYISEKCLKIKLLNYLLHYGEFDHNNLNIDFQKYFTVNLNDKNVADEIKKKTKKEEYIKVNELFFSFWKEHEKSLFLHVCRLFNDRFGDDFRLESKTLLENVRKRLSDNQVFAESSTIDFSVDMIDDNSNTFRKELKEELKKEIKKLREKYFLNYLILFSNTAVMQICNHNRDDIFELRNKYKLGFNSLKDCENNFCSVCSIYDTCGVATYLNAFADEKRFLIRRDQMHQIPMYLCGVCSSKVNTFAQFIDSKKIKIIPLFFDNNLDKIKKNKIYLFNVDGNNATTNTFNKTMNLLNKDKLDYILLCFSNSELLFYDYIYNYNWRINDLNMFSEGFVNYNKEYTREQMGYIIKKQIGISDFFSKAKTEPGYSHQFKHALFSFIYRGKNFSYETWDSMFNIIFHTKISTNKFNYIESSFLELLSIYFNFKHIVGGVTMDEDNLFTVINNIRSEIKIMVDKKQINEEYFITFLNNHYSPYVQAYFLGMLYGYFSDQREGNKSGLNLGRITNSNSLKLMIDETTKLLAKYSYKIKLNQKIKSLINNILSTNVEVSNTQIKASFLVGYADKSFFYIKTKKENDEVDTND